MTRLLLQDVSKSFPGVQALRNVSFDVLPGEIHVLCGENGAGKSTLMNILSGNLQPDKGDIILDGRSVVLQNPQQAFGYGISIVHQHLSLIENLTVAENVYANRQPVNRLGFIDFARLFADTETWLKQLGIDWIPPDEKILKLPAAHKQLIEIAKALARDPTVLILDEPTASLTERETMALFAILRKLKARNVSMIYISHRLQELFEIGDRITVLKDGTYQGTFERNGISRDELISRMIGRELTTQRGVSSRSDEVCLRVNGLSGVGFQNISFSLHRGEILGFAGLVGAGRTEIAKAIFGAGEIHRGNISLKGKSLAVEHSSSAIKAGLAYVPEERKTLGLFPQMTIADNILSGRINGVFGDWFIRPRQWELLASGSLAKLNIKATGIGQKVNDLSGGNQQKVVLAKWLLNDPEILILDEPTHGIDVGAKFEIYEIIRTLVSNGKSVLVISSDIGEMLALCDRIIVLRQGEISGEVDGAQATEKQIMNYAAI